MANTPKWNVRLRHEWLQTPLKKKRFKKNEKLRLGIRETEAPADAKKATEAQASS
jgi:hypothetical protein